MNGGPAFPSVIPLIHSEEQGKDYPSFEASGMSLRDYFASDALAGLVTKGIPADVYACDAYAAKAYMLADAMLRERAR